MDCAHEGADTTEPGVDREPKLFYPRGVPVESARSAVPVLPPVRFSVPLAEPGVPVSEYRALTASAVQAWLRRVQGLGIVLPL